jgi:hypothetical protein
MSSSSKKEKKQSKEPIVHVVERHDFVDPDDPDNIIRTSPLASLIVNDAVSIDIASAASSESQSKKSSKKSKEKVTSNKKDNDNNDNNNDIDEGDANDPVGPPRHLDELIVCATEPLVESHVCDDETLAPVNMAPELVSARRQMRAAMIVGAFRHTVLQATLPDTLFRDRDLSFIENSVFKTTDPSSELRSLAFDEVSGLQRRLTREQLAQLSRTGTFTVPSMRYPDLEHEWQVSALLVHGTRNIVDDWRAVVAISAGQLLWQVPGRFVRRSKEDFSVASAFISIFLGLFYAVALLFGFIEREQAYGSYATNSLRSLYGMLHLRATGKALWGGDGSSGGGRQRDVLDGDDNAIAINEEIDVDAADIGADFAAEFASADNSEDAQPAPSSSSKKSSSKSRAHVDARDQVPQIDEAVPFAHWPPHFHSPPNRLVDDLFVSERHRAELAAWRASKKLPPEPTSTERARWLCLWSRVSSITALDDKSFAVDRTLLARRVSISRVVDALVQKQTNEWKDRHDAELAKVIRKVADARGLDVEACLKGTDKELVRSIASEVSSELARVYNDELLERIKSADYGSVVDSHDKLAQHVHDVVLARWIVQQNRADSSRVATIRDRLEQRRLQEARPVMARVSGWFEASMAQYNEQLAATLKAQFDSATVAELRAAGLTNDAYLYERSRLYDTKLLRADEARLGTYMNAKREFTMNVRIWLPSNWHIYKHKGSRHYTVDKHATWEVRTGHVFWRWHLFIVMMFAYWKNIVFYLLLVNVFAGPLSLRALFSPSKFYPDKTIDENTGQVITNRSVAINSFPGLLFSLWSNVGKMRREFEARPDSGLIGKGLTRVFNLVWCYIVVGLFGTLLLVIFMPAAILLNCALSIALAVTAIVWWPIALLIGFLFALLIYDWLHARYGDVWFPLPMALIGRVLVLGVVRMVLAVLFAVVVHPLVALACFLFACLRASARWTWDKLMMFLILKRRGRVPASDEFLTRRVRGPGLSFVCAFQIPTDAALVALRAQLELLELRELQRRVEWIETSPSVWLHRALKRTFEGVLSTYSASASLSHEVRGREDVNAMRNMFQMRLAARRKLIPNDVRNGDLRQTADMLSNTIVLAEQVVELFVKERILAALSQKCPHVPEDMPNQTDHSQDSFWVRQGVKKGDFRALTAKLLTNALGARFLEPLEESDRVIKLEAKHTRMSDIVENVLTGVKSPPLRVNTYVYNERELDSENDEKRINQRIALIVSTPAWFSEAGI